MPPAFRRVTDLIALNRGFPEIDRRIDIVAGHVVVGSTGSNQTRNHTVIDDTANLA